MDFSSDFTCNSLHIYYKHSVFLVLYFFYFDSSKKIFSYNIYVPDQFLFTVSRLTSCEIIFSELLNVQKKSKSMKTNNSCTYRHNILVKIITCILNSLPTLRTNSIIKESLVFFAADNFE